MMTEKEFREKVCRLGSQDLDCSLEQFEREVDEDFKDGMRTDYAYWSKKPDRLRQQCIAWVWREHSKHFRRKF